MFLLKNDLCLLVKSKLYLSTLMKNNGKFLIYSFPYPALPGPGSKGMISACIFGTPLIETNVNQKFNNTKKTGPNNYRDRPILFAENFN